MRGPVVFLLAMLVFVLPPQSRSEVVDVTLLHTNDFHSQLGRKDSVITTIRSLRERYPQSLLLDAGDAFEEKVPAAVMSGGEAVAEFLDEAGYDGMTLGDNEFTGFGITALKNWMRNVKFPVLSANLLEKSGGDPLTLPYWIYRVNGASVGVIGIYDEEALVEFGILIAKPKKVIRHYARRLKDKADCVVLLSHQGIKQDRETAEEIEGIDVIVGGSSQTILKTPEKVEDSVIVQAGAYGRYVGVLEMQVDTEKNQVVSYHGRLVETE